MTINVTDENYAGFIESGTVLLDIKAEWCGPCKQISPIVEELSNEYDDVKIGKMDADINKETLNLLGIRSIPTLIVFKDGQIMERHTGMIQKSQLKSLIDKHIN
jgi:thioredoxin 1